MKLKTSITAGAFFIFGNIGFTYAGDEISQIEKEMRAFQAKFIKGIEEETSKQERYLEEIENASTTIPSEDNLSDENNIDPILDLSEQFVKLYKSKTDLEVLINLKPDVDKICLDIIRLSFKIESLKSIDAIPETLKKTAQTTPSLSS